ncbi:hypothetical protein AGR3A_Cc190122 [Agrobacterium tomkonis CFBP 6623]|uniref:Uncharacterized protein n=1 Tax=Agrobacterium tomkonis CFBP 6623 TaxID=1183432 RepID=A0A1S7P1R9_9HYPH|nr:hypothetical protein AGR3A_Cc190122 [Agrobacterium tomkonis CFBP 6623]
MFRYEADVFAYLSNTLTDFRGRAPEVAVLLFGEEAVMMTGTAHYADDIGCISSCYRPRSPHGTLQRVVGPVCRPRVARGYAFLLELEATAFSSRCVMQPIPMRIGTEEHQAANLDDLQCRRNASARPSVMKHISTHRRDIRIG